MAQVYPQISRTDPAAVLELLKPITWFAPMWALGCGVVSSGVPLAEIRWPVALAGVLLAGPLVCGTSQAVNDWFDRHVDAILDRLNSLTPTQGKNKNRFFTDEPRKAA